MKCGIRGQLFLFFVKAFVNSLHGHECNTLQIYDKDWSEWVNVREDFTLTADRLKLKGAVLHTNDVASRLPRSNTASRNIQQATLKSSNSYLDVNKGRLLTTNPPYFSLLIPNAHSPRLTYYNEITPIIYNETSEEFIGAERCRHYVITRRRWRYDTDNLISGFTSSSENMESNNPSGLKKNVCRYQSLPRDLNSGDISRCANTISTLESKMSEGEKIKDQLKEKQENLLFIFHECSPGSKQQAAISHTRTDLIA